MQVFALFCKGVPALTSLHSTSGTVMCIPTHNYQVSCPHRLDAFEQALEYITGHEGVWLATVREIAAHFLDNHYEDALASIKAGARGGA